MKSRIISATVLGLLCAYGYAQEDQIDLEEVVVSDSRFELKRENSGKTVITISSQEIQQNQGRSLAELINTKSGIEINGSRSNAGQNLGTYIRGGNNRQVLVMIDGIQVSDPSQIANDYDLRLVDLGQIESVEIIKGASSTLYGNSAATAVINITTKKPAHKPVSISLQSAVGTNQSSADQNYDLASFTNEVNVNGSLGDFSYLAGFGNQYTDGLSAVTGDERDPFNRINSRLKLGYRFSNSLSLNIYGNYDKFKADFDNSYPLEDAEFYSESEQYRVGIAPKFSYKNGSLQLNAAFNEISRDIESTFPSDFTANSTVADIFNKYNFNDRFYTIIGLNYIKSEADFNESQSFSITDPYINAVWVSDFGFHINTGVRMNNHSEYGEHFTYNFNPSYTYKIGNRFLKAMGTYATSYIAPSLSQMFGYYGANPDLKPEENQTIEGGFEYGDDHLRISALYFNRNHKNYIAYLANGYENTEEEFRVDGVEVELEAGLLQDLRFLANYTFTQNKDRTALRIPKHKLNAGLGYDLAKRTKLGLNYQFTGKRTDTDFVTYENVELHGFSLLDFNISHQLLENRLNLFFNLNNILNQDYTEVYGYTTKGRNCVLGLNILL